MNETFWAALCLMLVFEGVLPFAAPHRWRAMMLQAAQLTDAQLRGVGLAAMLLGMGLLLWLHSTLAS
ncbi:hypothetical protein BFW38_01590 [Terasakiispira papahanaumokuakeensis]|uniref:DUF2065 domain-containing protein n=1 Tax=Terasakiispira papahanaumokuakeensis TaxID=197479 RepID=A0A1E2V620_9GAMM|nr:DUF2065 domain-containing protein [Terasakiispira papahanaumokuakeensis]ODC02427.1 hypothetical protein BFW38_01590 [Terasakiispira papahanaumokuakeensis]